MQDKPTEKTKREARRLETTAYHEAGHAVVAWRLGLRIVVVSINPRGDAEGWVAQSRLTIPDDGKLNAKLYMTIQQTIVAKLAGVEAEARLRGRRSHSAAGGDYKRVAELIVALGFSGREYLEVARAYYRFALLLAKTMVENDWPLVEVLAGELLRFGSLNGNGVNEVLTAAVKRGEGS